VVGLDEAEKHAGKGGFATAAFADDGEGFARLNGKAYVVNGEEAVARGFVGEQATTAAVGFAEVARFEQRRRGSHRRTHLAEWSVCGGRNAGTA